MPVRLHSFKHAVKWLYLLNGIPERPHMRHVLALSCVVCDLTCLLLLTCASLIAAPFVVDLFVHVAARLPTVRTALAFRRACLHYAGLLILHGP